MIDCSLYEESTEMSLNNMRQIAITESFRNHYNIMSRMTPNITYITPPTRSQNDQLDEEHILQRGLQIGKKNCLYKRPEYDQGSWTQQFRRILPTELENTSNFESKKKTPIMMSEV